MATTFSRYLLALAEIATKIDLLTRKYLIANARNFVKTLLGLSIENSDPIYSPGYLHVGMTIKLIIITCTSVVSQGHSMLLDATFELVQGTVAAVASRYS